MNEGGGLRFGLALAGSLVLHAAIWWVQPAQPPRIAYDERPLQLSLLQPGVTEAPPTESALAEPDPAESPPVVETPDPAVNRPPIETAPRQPVRSSPVDRPEPVPRQPTRPAALPTPPTETSASAVPASSAAASETVPAQVLANPKPQYPRQARRRGLEGQVLLVVEVRPDGLPGRIDIVAGSGHAILDQAALEGLRLWRFQPARRGGQAIAATLRIPVSFRLN